MVGRSRRSRARKCNRLAGQTLDAKERSAGRTPQLTIHSIAYAPREALGGEYLDTSREAFLTALEISAYSLAQLSRAAAPLIPIMPEPAGAGMA